MVLHSGIVSLVKLKILSGKTVSGYLLSKLPVSHRLTIMGLHSNGMQPFEREKNIAANSKIAIQLREDSG